MEAFEAIFDATPFNVVNFEESLEMKVCHAAHCTIYSLIPYTVCHSYESKAYISMHLRTDGRFGTPGGNIDEKEGTDIVRGLNRELVEEYALKPKYFATEKNHFLSLINKEETKCYHCYIKEVSVDDFKEIESDALHGSPQNSVLGVVRVPLYTTEDGFGGFPAFLANRFAGCSKYNLLAFLLHKNIMSFEEIKGYLE